MAFGTNLFQVALPVNVITLLKICMLVLNKKNYCELLIFLNCNVGVRQGENLSPFLFSVYISDLEKHLIEKGISGLENLSKYIEDDLCIF